MIDSVMEEWSGSSIEGSLDHGDDFDSPQVAKTSQQTHSSRVYEFEAEVHKAEHAFASSSAFFEQGDSSGRRDNESNTSGDFALSELGRQSFEQTTSGGLDINEILDEESTREQPHAEKDQFSSARDSKEDFAALLIPACVKVNSTLTQYGYSVIDLTASDIDVQRRSMSVFIVDAWAESVLGCIQELIEKQHTSQEIIQDASSSRGFSDAANEVLESRFRTLESRYESCIRKEKETRLMFESKEKECELLKKQLADLNSENKKKIRNLEHVVQESDRKLRQRDVDIEKMRGKFQSLANRNRTDSARMNRAMSAHVRGEAGTVISHNSSPSTPVGHTSQMISSPASRIKDSPVTSQDIIFALESERSELLQHTSELESQVASLTKKLSKIINDSQKGAADDMLISTSTPVRSTPKASDNAPEASTSSHETIREQSTRIQQLVHQLEMEKQKTSRQNDDIEAIRNRYSEMKSEVENLRIELDARPTVPQWNEKLRQVTQLENELHDVILLRDESHEISEWKRHLSTREKIKADRRNHELKLWLLDSLPKNVMKDVLQGICRELDLCEISDIIPAISKLKTVVRAVPRMEKFITSVCNYVFRHESPKHDEGDVIARPVMEDVLPVLKRWWSYKKDFLALSEFQEKIFYVVRQVDATKTIRSFNDLEVSQLAKPSDESPAASIIETQSFRKSDSYSLPIQCVQRSQSEDAIVKIQSLIDFQDEIFRSAQNYVSAQKFISERPDVMVNSLVSHVMYLFGVKSLRGFIPRMNEVYLFTQEMCNFMTTLRTFYKMKTSPGATVITETYRRVKVDTPEEQAGRRKKDVLAS
mmetsp:Transcript_9391/g.14152  ORF Transcript_9391/g.14152 Transcript_9391/m.14152 type:complete len:824 (+) Transcript_9391:73-2544(+)